MGYNNNGFSSSFQRLLGKKLANYAIYLCQVYFELQNICYKTNSLQFTSKFALKIEALGAKIFGLCFHHPSINQIDRDFWFFMLFGFTTYCSSTLTTTTIIKMMFLPGPEKALVKPWRASFSFGLYIKWWGW